LAPDDSGNRLARLLDAKAARSPLGNCAENLSFDAPVAEILQRGFEMLANTAQFDCTHLRR
jgi:hypothetical protein